MTGRIEEPTKRDIDRQARALSAEDNLRRSPLARFEDRLCPGVVGLKDDYAAFVIQRIRYNAERLGLWMTEDDGTCEPNFIVAFLPNGRDQFVELRRKRGYLFTELSNEERSELTEHTGPARVWTNILMRTRDGMPVPSSRASLGTPDLVFTDPNGNQITLNVPVVAGGEAAHSRIYLPVREDIVSVLVVFEPEMIRHLSLIQLADYATMRGLARTRETRGEPAAATILSLFDGDGPKPERLTAFDFAYLESLYDGLPNLPALTKIANVRHHMPRQEDSKAGRR